MADLGSLKVRKENNYVAYFITLACNLKCQYCINLHNGGSRYAQATRSHMTAEDWIKAANRLVLRDDLPLTLQGGEPTLYKGFYKLVNEVKPEIKMDLLTNMEFDTNKFIKNVPVSRFTRKAPYASIRVSYHPGQNDIKDLVKKTFKLEAAGFRIGIYGILHPDKKKREHILKTQDKCRKAGIDFRTKEFLGEWNGKLYGTYRYKDSVMSQTKKYCECKTTEVIVDPGGYVYRCHSDLQKGRTPVAHILDKGLTMARLDKFRSCYSYGDCNPCDVKVKTNRLQVFGHTSVKIRNIDG